MSHTEMDRETCEVEYGLEQTDLETCPKSVWSPERRERVVSPIGDRLRVTRAREIRKRLTQAERKRKSVVKKAHGERETRASTRTNPVLSKGHLQDVAHPATVDPAESSSETELYSLASLSETVRFQPLRAGSFTKEREHVLNGKGSDSDGSRRRDRVEPTPTREQTALGRRSPQDTLDKLSKQTCQLLVSSRNIMNFFNVRFMLKLRLKSPTNFANNNNSMSFGFNPIKC